MKFTIKESLTSFVMGFVFNLLVFEPTQYNCTENAVIQVMCYDKPNVKKPLLNLTLTYENFNESLGHNVT
jgi:hypothetical protein